MAAGKVPTFLNMFPPQSPTTLTTLTPFKASVKEEKSNKEKLLGSMCDPQKGGGQPTCQVPPQQRPTKRPGPGRPPGGRGKRKPGDASRWTIPAYASSETRSWDVTSRKTWPVGFNEEDTQKTSLRMYLSILNTKK
uniref:Uncharacterized protein n=1 Tax=Timema genevievae TaxID=629358 RepID=A0A7R9K782_TIMGE|nr:unnamed protein product [Timema genevievae]